MLRSGHHTAANPTRSVSLPTFGSPPLPQLGRPSPLPAARASSCDSGGTSRATTPGRFTTFEERLMADSGTLHDAFLDELRDVYDGEKQLIKARGKLGKAAASPDLRHAFETHL